MLTPRISSNAGLACGCLGSVCHRTSGPGRGHGLSTGRLAAGGSATGSLTLTGGSQPPKPQHPNYTLKGRPVRLQRTPCPRGAGSSRPVQAQPWQKQKTQNKQPSLPPAPAQERGSLSTTSRAWQALVTAEGLGSPPSRDARSSAGRGRGREALRSPAWRLSGPRRVPQRAGAEVPVSPGPARPTTSEARPGPGSRPPHFPLVAVTAVTPHSAVKGLQRWPCVCRTSIPLPGPQASSPWAQPLPWPVTSRPLGPPEWRPCRRHPQAGRPLRPSPPRSTLASAP